MKAKSPIFIVGCPRSGTTLLRLMLDSHPSISIPEETGLFFFLYSYSGRQRWRFSSPSDRKSLFERMERSPNLQRAFGQDLVLDVINTLKMKKSLTEKMIIDSLFEAYVRQTGKTVWGEKTPTHFYYINDILKLYPQAAIICLIRDPRAVFASRKRYAQTKKGTEGYYPWMSENPEKVLMMWLDCYENVMKWKDRIFFIKYEELVLSPEAVLKDLTESFLNVPYSPEMLEYYKTAEDRLANIPDCHKFAAQRITPANANRWRSELTPEEIERVESILHRQMKEFGYELESSYLGNAGNIKITLKRNMYKIRRRARLLLTFAAWRTCRSLRLIP